MAKNITLVRGDDTNFLNQVLLVVHFKTNLDLTGYKMRLTLENPTNMIKTYEVINNAVQIDLSKDLTSTLEIGEHKCNIKLFDTLNRVKTVKNFTITVEDEFNVTAPNGLNEYELEVVLDDGINKYKNYNEQTNKPSVNGVILEGDKSLKDLGITEYTEQTITNAIEKHNTDPESHQFILNELRRKQDHLIAGTNITIENGIISSLGTSGVNSTNYKLLNNKPAINGKILIDNLSLDELGVQPKGEYITAQDLESKGYLTEVPSGYITEEELEAEGYIKTIPDEYFTDEENEAKYTTKLENDIKQDKLTPGENITIEDNIINANIPEEYVTEEELNQKGYTTPEALKILLDRKQNTLLAGNNIKLYRNIDGTYTISALSPKDIELNESYNALTNKPAINNTVLTGNKSLEDLGIQPIGEYQNKLVVGDNISIDENNVISAIIPEDICTDIELQAGLATKANKADNLEDYGIKNAYTKEETINKIFENKNNSITNTIIEAPNGIISYTEHSITVKSGLRVLFSNGYTPDYKFKNIDSTLDKDLTIDVSNYKFLEPYTSFYVIVNNINGVMGMNLIPQSELSARNDFKLANTLRGYIRHVNYNKFYRMVPQDDDTCKPEQVYINIVAEGKAIDDGNGYMKIMGIIPYNTYRFSNINDTILQVKDKQDKLEFGDNFEVKNNKVNYKVPYNYVTKEYLIDGQYATRTDINDAIDTHDIDVKAHNNIIERVNTLENDRTNYTKQGNTFNLANQLVKLDSEGKLPAIDGSKLFNLSTYSQSEMDRMLTQYVKKNNTYTELNTSVKTIVGAINELNNKIGKLETFITQLQTQTDDQKTDVNNSDNISDSGSVTPEQPIFITYEIPKFNSKYVDSTIKYSTNKTVTERFNFTPSEVDWSLVFTPIRYPVTFSVDYTSSFKNLMTVEQNKITLNRIPSENIVEEIEIDTTGASFELLHRKGEGLYLYVWRNGLLEKEYTLSNVDMQLTYRGYKIENVNSTFEFTSEHFKKNYASLNYDYSTTMVLPDFE